MDPFNEIRNAMLACRDGRFDAAERISREVLAANPLQPQANLVLCQTLLATGRIAEAEKLAAFALEGNSGHPDLLACRGEALGKLNRTDEAIACYDEAIERRLINPAAHHALDALLAKRDDPVPRFTVSIITATVGSPHLIRAIQSVQAQSYPLLEHVIVADGPDHNDSVHAMLPRETAHPVQFLCLPINTGGHGFCGHRVYGAAPFLVNSRFVAFLDEDNWLEPHHVVSLMAKITRNGLAWAYALRNIVNSDGQFVGTDDCQSLGQWPAWNDPSVHLVDVSCYMLRRDLAIAVSPLWYRRYHDEENPDFVICRHLLKNGHRCATSGLYTVNYRVRGSADTWPTIFFLRGNAVVRQRFANKLPWRDPNMVRLA